MIGNYAIRQASQILGREPGEIIGRIRKGGIQGVTVEQTDDGFTYLLSRESINQLGTAMKVIPNFDNVNMRGKSDEMVQIKPTVFDQEIRKIGVSRATIASVIGCGPTYISNCQARGVINKKYLDELERIYGLDQKKVLNFEKHEATTAPDKIDHESIRKAVCNGVVDALLVVLKDEYMSNVLARALERDKVEQALQKCIFNAMNGVRNLEAREKSGLVPQKR